jgi:hypothetical protein
VAVSLCATAITLPPVNANIATIKEKIIRFMVTPSPEIMNTEPRPVATGIRQRNF